MTDSNTPAAQPEALRLANALDDGSFLLWAERGATAAELRRLHAQVATLTAPAQPGSEDAGYRDDNWWRGWNAAIRHCTVADSASSAQTPAGATITETVPFLDQSTASPVEKARRYLAAMGDKRLNDAYFFNDGFPKRESASDALATLAILEQLEARVATTAQPAPAGADWWRKRADEIESTVAVTGSQEAMRCYTDMRTLLQAATAPPAPAAPFQQRVQPWLLECFGAEIAADRVERNHRFLEEALELVQTLGCTASEAHQLVDYVFGRTVGEPAQEVGGVMVTLAALCLASGLDMHRAGEVELARVSAPGLTAKIRAKQAAKPKHSPLPEAAPAASCFFVGDRVTCDFHQGIPAAITELREEGGFDYTLEKPQDLGPPYGLVAHGTTFTFDGWRRLPPAASPAPLNRQQLCEAYHRSTGGMLGGDIHLAERVCRVVEQAHGITQAAALSHLGTKPPPA